MTSAHRSGLADVLPLAPLQEGLLFHSLLRADDATGDGYTVQLCFELAGEVDAERLRAAIEALLARHANLRAGFRHEKLSRPVQIIPHEVVLPWQVVDLSTLDAPAADAALARLIEQDRSQPFDLARPPLLRASLVRLGEGRALLMITHHHILLDGWSMPILVRELFDTYAADVSVLPPVVPYKSYLGWLARQDRAAAETAWQQALAGLDEPTLLGAPDGHGACHQHTVRVSQSITEQLRMQAAAHGLTLNSVVQGAWGLLLSRQTGKQDIVFGATVSGRPEELPGVESIVGLLINTLPVRVTFNPARPLAGALADMQAQQAGLIAHQHLGLADIQRISGHSALFDTIAVFENYPLDPAALTPAAGDLAVTSLTINDGTHYALGLIADPVDGGLDLRIDYRSDAFTDLQAVALAQRLTAILAACAESLDQPAGRISALTAEETTRVVEEWNTLPGFIAVRPTGSIADRFAKIAAAHPEAIAISDADRRLSYADLDARANQLARLLIDEGIRPGDFVALALPRSVELVVALLAVVKAGGAYLPLDPKYPADRLDYTLNDANPTLVITSSSVAAGIPGADTCRRLILEDIVERLAVHPTTDPKVAVPVDSPAYVIYTSGSTGKPKGVVVSHGNVLRLLTSTEQWFGFGERDVWTLFHSYAFDFSVWELWGPMLYGGRLVVVDHPTSRSPEEFLGLLVREGVTVLNQTPSAFYQLMAADAADPELGARLALRYVVFGGEALDLPRLADWYARHADDAPVLVNMYGITETTVHVSYLALTAHDAEAGTGSLIGRAIPDLRIYVLDDNLNPTPPGVAGEMYVAGAGLALGYHARGALTASRFVADPFGAAGTRMYRSGDVARWTEQGNLEFLGRADDQVKIRGFRIELGEISSVLLNHPSVSQAVVVVREDAPGDRRLVGYVVPAAGEYCDQAVLRAHAGAGLPDYMMPAAFVELAGIPLTGNGKLDRKALPAPEVAVTSAQPVADPVVELICGLFADVLGVPTVGGQDNFFALGGHSLLATRLVSRVRAELKAELTIRALFESPTPAGLAALVRAADGARPPLTPMPRPDVLPQSFAQRRLWFLDRLDTAEGIDSAAYNVPLALRLHGPLNVTALRDALSDLVGRHETLRTVFPDVDGIGRQLVLPAERTTLDLSIVPVTEADLDAVLDRTRRIGFDLAAQPPLRATLLRIANDEHVLLLVLHHIAADGWSMAPLARDLSRAYALRAGCASALPLAPLPVQYADYTLWQRELLGDEQDEASLVHRQLEHWRRTLAGLPDEISLPTDRSRPAQVDQRGESIELTVPAELHRAVREFARAARGSLFMVLQAALASLYTRLGAGTDIPLGTPLAGRTDAALDELIGFFINSLVLRTDTSGDPTFRDLVHRVREVDLAAYANQDVPFERVIDALNPERLASRHPLFQTVLTVRNLPDADLEFPGLTVAEIPFGAAGAKYDLCFEFTEHADTGGDPAGMRCVIDFSRALFDAQTVVGIGNRLLRLLASAVAEPNKPISSHEILDAAERKQLLVDVNGADVPVEQLPVDELVARRARQSPDALAVTAENEQLTYAELDTRANQLARLLVGRGIGAEQFVAVALTKRADLIVALLAVLKTGAGYLPLDPNYPADRIAFMVSDAAPPLLITESAVLPGLPDNGSPLVIDDPAVRADIAARPSADIQAAELNWPRDMANPAYVIYTSGSTGRPKGVIIEHRALATYLAWTTKGYPSTTGMTLLHSPISFDLTVTALYTTLVNGGRVHLTALEDGDANRAVLSEQDCGFLKATPSHLALLQALPESYSPKGQLLLGGELLLGESLAAFRERSPQTTVLNVYGQTETTVNCTEFRVHPGDEDRSGALPVGRPFDNVAVHVLDRTLRPVPAGVVGDVYVAGGQLGRGYHNRFALTAERFVANPFGPPGSRMYRSGDLARRDADGLLYFIGRADDQVKVRGFRIELGEIESVTVAHPSVAQAAVIVREDTPGDRRLVGYVVAAAGETVSPTELRTHVAAAVPDYMVPVAFVVLAELPLTPNGKLDRKVLPAPDFNEIAGSRAARDDTEATLAALFADVLGLDSVGIDDNFFDLGGDSIISIQLVARARKAGLVITPRNVFEHKTVAALAKIAGSLDTAAKGEPDVGIGEVPLTPSLARFRERGGPINGYNQSMLLHAPDGLTEEILRAAVQTVLDHHDALRLRLDRDDAGTQWALTVPPVGAVAAEDVVSSKDIRGLGPAQVRELISAESVAAWARTAPELGRQLLVVFFDAGGNGKDRLLIVAHHMVIDGVSWRILIEDLAEACTAVAAGQNPKLQPVGTSFRRWAQRLHAAAYEPTRIGELDAWTETLDEFDPLLGERPLDPTQDTIADLHYLVQNIDTELTEPLLSTVAAAYHASANDVLLCALTLAVARWRGKQDDADEPTTSVLVDLEGHGREDIATGVDTSRTIGWFTSRYPVRLDAGELDWSDVDSGGPAVGAALKSVKEALRARAGYGIGYGLLRYLNHDTRAGLADLLEPQLSFNYLGRFKAAKDNGAGAAWTAATDADTVGGADLSGGRPDPRTPMSHTLSINATTEEHADGPKLVVMWSWPRLALGETEVRGLSEEFANAVRALVKHAETGGGGFTPSDLNLVSLTQNELDVFNAVVTDDDLSEADEDDAEFADWEVAK